MGLAIVKLRKELGRLAHKTSPKFFSSAKRQRVIFLCLLRHDSELGGGGGGRLVSRAENRIKCILARTFYVPVACQTGRSWGLLPEPEIRSEGLWERAGTGSEFVPQNRPIMPFDTPLTQSLQRGNLNMTNKCCKFSDRGLSGVFIFLWLTAIFDDQRMSCFGFTLTLLLRICSTGSGLLKMTNPKF